MSYLNPSKAEVRRTRLLVGGAAVVITAIVMTGFLVENQSGYSPPDSRLIYFENWSGDRSRADALADVAATKAAREAKLAEARTFIATLSGEKKAAAQAQYDNYVNGGGDRKEIPYVRARPPERLVVPGSVSVPAEPPVM